MRNRGAGRIGGIAAPVPVTPPGFEAALLRYRRVATSKSVRGISRPQNAGQEGCSESECELGGWWMLDGAVALTQRDANLGGPFRKAAREVRFQGASSTPCPPCNRTLMLHSSLRRLWLRCTAAFSSGLAFGPVSTLIFSRAHWSATFRTRARLLLLRQSVTLWACTLSSA